MKKTFGLVLSFVVFSSASFSQESPRSAAKVMTASEANALNGTAQPTINGKPYSQYKAEQEALQRAREQKKATVPSDMVTVQPGDIKQAQPKVAPTGSGNPENPVVKPNVESAVVKADAPKPQQAPTLHEQIMARSKDFTGNGPDGKPAPSAEKAGRPGTEGGGTAPVPAATVSTTKNAVTSSAGPVAPAVQPDAATGNGNSSSGTVEKPAPQPAPKTKSDQAPEGKTGEGN